MTGEILAQPVQRRKRMLCIGYVEPVTRKIVIYGDPMCQRWQAEGKPQAAFTWETARRHDGRMVDEIGYDESTRPFLY